MGFIGFVQSQIAGRFCMCKLTLCPSESRNSRLDRKRKEQMFIQCPRHADVYRCGWWFEHLTHGINVRDIKFRDHLETIQSPHIFINYVFNTLTPTKYTNAIKYMYSLLISAEACRRKRCILLYMCICWCIKDVIRDHRSRKHKYVVPNCWDL